MLTVSSCMPRSITLCYFTPFTEVPMFFVHHFFVCDPSMMLRSFLISTEVVTSPRWLRLLLLGNTFDTCMSYSVHIICIDVCWYFRFVSIIYLIPFPSTRRLISHLQFESALQEMVAKLWELRRRYLQDLESCTFQGGERKKYLEGTSCWYMPCLDGRMWWASRTLWTMWIWPW